MYCGYLDEKGSKWRANLGVYKFQHFCDFASKGICHSITDVEGRRHGHLEQSRNNLLEDQGGECRHCSPLLHHPPQDGHTHFLCSQVPMYVKETPARPDESRRK